MKEKTIILVDWDNFRHDIEETKCVNYNIALDVVSVIKAFLLDDEVIGRIYFYATPPFDFEQALQEKENSKAKKSDKAGFEMRSFTKDDIEKILQSNEASRWNQLYEKIEKFQNDLALLDQIELRLGRTKLNAVRLEGNDDYSALLEQKQVDMLMGLDIARIALKKNADRILVFSKDTDLIPALKLARSEGLRVDIANLSDGLSLNPELGYNSDKVREMNTNEVKKKISVIKQNMPKTNWAF